MGNTHSGINLTRTSGALDSFVADLGGDIMYEKRCAYILVVLICLPPNKYPQPWLSSISEDGQVSASTWLLSC